MTLRQLVDATEILLDDLHGYGYTELLLAEFAQLDEQTLAEPEDREAVSNRRRANLIATYGPDVIG